MKIIFIRVEKYFSIIKLNMFKFMSMLIFLIIGGVCIIELNKRLLLNTFYLFFCGALIVVKSILIGRIQVVIFGAIVFDLVTYSLNLVYRVDK